MKYKQIGGIRQSLPKSWTLKDGSQTGNFDLLPESVHNDEGWYQCVDDQVVATPETHKLGDDTLVDGKWQRAVIDKTVDDLADDLADGVAMLISHTKSLANQKILAFIPEVHQRNAMARAIELQEIRHELGELDYDDAAELVMIREIFTDFVKPTRTASDTIEAEILSGKIQTVEQVENHIAWEV